MRKLCVRMKRTNLLKCVKNKHYLTHLVQKALQFVIRSFEWLHQCAIFYSWTYFLFEDSWKCQNIQYIAQAVRHYITLCSSNKTAAGQLTQRDTVSMLVRMFLICPLQTVKTTKNCRVVSWCGAAKVGQKEFKTGSVAWSATEEVKSTIIKSADLREPWNQLGFLEGVNNTD